MSAGRTPPLFFSLSFFNYIIFLNELLVYWTLEVHNLYFTYSIIIIIISNCWRIEPRSSYCVHIVSCYHYKNELGIPA